MKDKPIISFESFSNELSENLQTVSEIRNKKSLVSKKPRKPNLSKSLCIQREKSSNFPKTDVMLSAQYLNTRSPQKLRSVSPQMTKKIAVGNETEPSGLEFLESVAEIMTGNLVCEEPSALARECEQKAVEVSEFPRRGRPRSSPDKRLDPVTPDTNVAETVEKREDDEKTRSRAKPRKVPIEENEKVKKKIGRPRKSVEHSQSKMKLNEDDVPIKHPGRPRKTENNGDGHEKERTPLKSRGRPRQVIEYRELEDNLSASSSPIKREQPRKSGDNSKDEGDENIVLSSARPRGRPRKTEENQSCLQLKETKHKAKSVCSAKPDRKQRRSTILSTEKSLSMSVLAREHKADTESPDIVRKRGRPSKSSYDILSSSAVTCREPDTADTEKPSKDVAKPVNSEAQTTDKEANLKVSRKRERSLQLVDKPSENKTPKMGLSNDGTANSQDDSEPRLKSKTRTCSSSNLKRSYNSEKTPEPADSPSKSVGRSSLRSRNGSESTEPNKPTKRRKLNSESAATPIQIKRDDGENLTSTNKLVKKKAGSKWQFAETPPKTPPKAGCSILTPSALSRIIDREMKKRKILLEAAPQCSPSIAPKSPTKPVSKDSHKVATKRPLFSGQLNLDQLSFFTKQKKADTGYVELKVNVATDESPMPSPKQTSDDDCIILDSPTVTALELQSTRKSPRTSVDCVIVPNKHNLESESTKKSTRVATKVNQRSWRDTPNQDLFGTTKIDDSVSSRVENLTNQTFPVENIPNKMYPVEMITNTLSALRSIPKIASSDKETQDINLPAKSISYKNESLKNIPKNNSPQESPKNESLTVSNVLDEITEDKRNNPPSNKSSPKNRRVTRNLKKQLIVNKTVAASERRRQVQSTASPSAPPTFAINSELDSSVVLKKVTKKPLGGHLSVQEKLGVLGLLKSGLSVSEVSRSTGWTYSSIQNWKRSEERLSKIAEKLLTPKQNYPIIRKLISEVSPKSETEQTSTKKSQSTTAVDLDVDDSPPQSHTRTDPLVPAAEVHQTPTVVQNAVSHSAAFESLAQIKREICQLMALLRIVVNRTRERLDFQRLHADKVSWKKFSHQQFTGDWDL